MNHASGLERDPLWYKDAVIYQLHVKSFFDAKEDGIGDFLGLTQKLRYLESLGVNAVWLLPFYPSPQRDDGYDIADYLNIHPNYGTMAEFKTFLEEAHTLGIRVITELVLNHTSDQHEWFKNSRSAEPGSYWRDFYVWSDANDRYRDARIIFKDFETSNWCWDPLAKAYYWHRFYAHQPDLNFENPHVHEALFTVIDFWLGMGVDGLRLDAVPYLYEQEETNCENLPQTFAFLKTLRAHVEERFPGRMLLAEANQWPEDAVAYFGNGDMCHMAFHFPLMPRMFMALQMEDRFPIIDILDQTPAIPESAQWAIFLRNHDELTLEMVSEEERDFMYRTYARELSSRINLGIRRRLAPLLHNSRRRIELLNILLFSLPGSPVIYYGDEIGMGDNHYLGDRNGVRSPMQWSADRNAGFSKVNPQRIFLPVIIDPEYHYQTVNVENEERNLSSLLWWMRRAIAMRRTFQAFSRGSLEFVNSNNTAVLSFIRKLDDQVILVIVNLSRFSQAVTLDLAAYGGATPVDVFSGNRFPRIASAPYQMTMGFHDYFWMHLKTEKHSDLRTASYTLADFNTTLPWPQLFEDASARRIANDILPEYLQQRTTAGCRAKPIQHTVIVDRFTVAHENFTAVLLFVKIRYVDGDGDLIFLPLTVEPEARAAIVIGEDKGLIMGLVGGASNGLLYDCASHPLLQQVLLETITGCRVLYGDIGTIRSEPVGQIAGALPNSIEDVRIVKAGKRNTCVVCDRRVFVKLFRRLDEGANPDIGLHRQLSDAAAEIAPHFFGACRYKNSDSIYYDLGMYTEYFLHSKTLWRVAIDSVSQYLEETMANAADRTAHIASRAGSVTSGADGARGLPFGKKAETAGILTARMHEGLAQAIDNASCVEPFSQLFHRSLYQSFRGLVRRVCASIAAGAIPNPGVWGNQLKMLTAKEKEIISPIQMLLKKKLAGLRMRIHGDYHLGQIMVMDEKYRICDFEGRPSLSLSERRLKRSALRDVASMIHSFHCAAHSALLNNVKIQPHDRSALVPCAVQWAEEMSVIFTTSYVRALRNPAIVGSNAVEIDALIQFYLLERAFSELDIALETDPSYLPVTLRCLFHYLTKLPFAQPGRELP
jgi:maltose alpha-D-glucosyltransferase/alpha-amylase